MRTFASELNCFKFAELFELRIINRIYHTMQESYVIRSFHLAELVEGSNSESNGSASIRVGVQEVAHGQNYA
jgi:hypothetical protein